MQENNKEFFLLFYKRELHPLLGNKRSNLVILILMLFTTFTVIGFAEGSLRYLERKMKDPFINWVDIIPAGLSARGIGDLLSELNTAETEQKYGLKNAVGYNRFQLNFYQYEDIMNYYRTGDLDTNLISGMPARTIDMDDPIIQEVFSKKNLLSGNVFSDPLDIGLVITESMRRRLGYPENPPFMWMDLPVMVFFPEFTQKRLAIPIPVNAVVRNLPGLSHFSTTPYFYQQRATGIGNNPFNPLDNNRLVISFSGSDEQVRRFINDLESFFGDFEMPGEFRHDRIFSEPVNFGSDNQAHRVYITFSPRRINFDELENIFLTIYNSRNLSSYRNQIHRFYDYDLTMHFRHDEYDRVSLNFHTLDRLREFSFMLSDTRRIEVDMAQIESRENYNFVSRLTGIISVVLIAFSILSVLLFVVHLLKKHLESIKRNLGTFKAFGLSNRLLIIIYVRIVLSILGLAGLISLTLSAIFGYAGGMRIVLVFFGSHYEPGRYFSLMSIYLILAIIMLILFSVIVIRFITNKILNQTPGDLIYERQ